MKVELGGGGVWRESQGRVTGSRGDVGGSQCQQCCCSGTIAKNSYTEKPYSADFLMAVVEVVEGTLLFCFLQWKLL